MPAAPQVFAAVLILHCSLRTAGGLELNLHDRGRLADSLRSENCTRPFGAPRGPLEARDRGSKVIENLRPHYEVVELYPQLQADWNGPQMRTREAVRHDNRPGFLPDLQPWHRRRRCKSCESAVINNVTFVYLMNRKSGSKTFLSIMKALNKRGFPPGKLRRDGPPYE